MTQAWLTRPRTAALLLGGLLVLWGARCAPGPTDYQPESTPKATNQTDKSGVPSAARPPGPLPTFFELPIPPDARRIAFLIDASGRMTCPIEVVKPELKRCLCQLSEGDEFHVIFYSSNSTAELPERKLVHATEANKIKAFECIDGIITRGENDPTEALKRAFALEPDMVFLLTPCEVDPSVVNLVKNLNAKGEVMVNTISLLNDDGRTTLKEIAGQNRGTYKFVREHDLARILNPGADQRERAERRDYWGITLGGKPCKVVFVCDRSGSMTNSIDFSKYELNRCIDTLKETDEFGVLFFSTDPPLEMSPGGLVPATEANTDLAFDFVRHVIPQGDTEPASAIKRAFALQPETIFILTDGEFDKSVVDLVKSLNAGGKVTVHTVAFLYQTGGKVLKEIAEQNGGVYKFVSEADLARLPP